MVRLEIVLVVAASTVNTRTVLLPLIVRRFVPGPVMVVLSAIAGSAETSVIVPATVKEIESSPPAAFASRIAWRKEPEPESSVLVTVRIAAGVVAAANPQSNATRDARVDFFTGHL